MLKSVKFCRSLPVQGVYRMEKTKRRRSRRRSWGWLKTGLLLAVLGIALWKLAPDFIEVIPPQAVEENPSLSGDPEALQAAGDTPSLSGYPEALQALWEKNEDARPFVEGYFENKDKDFTIDLSREAEADAVPLLMQWDERWGYTAYSGGLLGCTGCGPTCLSMAAVYLTGNPDYSPKYVAQYATEQGYAVAGSGSAWALISEGAADFGLEAQELSLDEGRMAGVLAQGGVVICVLGPGDFTDSGHFIVLTGYEDGAFSVNDPNSYVNSSKTWTYDQLKGQIKNLWGLWAA